MNTGITADLSGDYRGNFGLERLTWIRTSMSESRETEFRGASGGGLRLAIGPGKRDSSVQIPIAKQS